MGWPYEFVHLSPEELRLRRHSLDFYACLAHYSALTPVLALLALRLVRTVARRLSLSLSGLSSAFASGSSLGSRPLSDLDPEPAPGLNPAPGLVSGPRHGRGAYEAVPPSPIAKSHRLASSGRFAKRWRILRWWLDDEITIGPLHCGRHGQWIIGLTWTLWLLFLCIVGTGKDFFHLTRRIGIIAVSQLPIQYLLSLKALNPFAWALGSSHEVVNSYHRLLGRIIYFLLLLHIILYNLHFILDGIWLRRFFDPIVFCAVVASVFIHALLLTSLACVRRRAYRLFFITHILAVFCVPALIFFHAPSARLYLVEAIAIFVLDLVVRKATSILSSANVEAVPGTDLVKISCPIPLQRLGPFLNFPGSHIYLSIPPGSRAGFIFNFLFNPFTIASVSEEEASITVVARVRNGPMTRALRRSALSSASEPSPEAGRLKLAIEGPRGFMMNHFDRLLDWGPSRILLVAGGVGATFVLPIYRALRIELPLAKTQLVWAVRHSGDASWAAAPGPGASTKNLLDDESVQVYLTGDLEAADADAGNDADDDNDDKKNDVDDAVEMQPLHPGPSHRYVPICQRRRPDMEAIVHDLFRHGSEEPVAILVCGPSEMATDLRRRVRPWVLKGRQVWWHSETFGW